MQKLRREYAIGGVNINTQKIFKKAGTHDGVFHADEVMATAILKEIFEIDLIRTREPKILNELDIVYDVGGGELDHHGNDKVYREDGTPFAACGLVWNKYGREAIQFEYPSLEQDEIDSIFYYVDRVLIEGIDAQDNGIKIKNESIKVMDVSSIISGFNPPWYSEYNEDEAFEEALEIASSILKNTIKRRFSVLKSKNNVIKAYEKRPNSKVLVLNEYCPWGEALRDIDEKKEVLFVVYPRKDEYTMLTVREKDGEDRKKFPKDWAGKRDEELAAASGVPDAVFCHTGRFIAVAKSYEGIMKMAELAINEPEEVAAGRFFRFINRLFRSK